MKKGFLGGVVLAVLIIIAVVLLGLCSVRVPAGYVAVQYDMNGGVKEKVLTQGWHITSPTVQTTLYTQKQIKDFVRIGVATDVTNWNFEQIHELTRKPLEKIAYSSGVYGLNGCLVRDTETGETYAITARNSALAQLY